jgi:hypothetical protein
MIIYNLFGRYVHFCKRRSTNFIVWSPYLLENKFMFYLLKKRGEVVPLRNVEAYRGSGGIAPLILNIGSKWH